MGTALIAFRNLADTATFSDGNWVTSLPLSNLSDRQPGLVARAASVSPGDTRLVLDFGTPKPVSFVALLRHNLTQNGRWRVQLARDQEFSQSADDSGVAGIWPQIQPFGVGVWGEFNWGGRLSSEEAATYGISAFHVAPQTVIARYLSIELFDELNPAGYLEAGRLVVGTAWRPSINMQYGWSIQQVDTSKSVKSRGGQSYVDIQPKFRRLRFSIDYLGRDEMFGNAYELERLKGAGGDLFVMIDPDDIVHRHRHSVYGVLQDTTPISNPVADRFSKSFTIDELL